MTTGWNDFCIDYNGSANCEGYGKLNVNLLNSTFYE
jgi:hypothetical protein